MPEDSPMDIDYVARLARIRLTGEERQTFAAQLGDILDYFQRIKDVDVSGVEPTAHAFDVFNVWDEDVPRPGLPLEDALRHAPAARDNQISVPKVIEDA